MTDPRKPIFDAFRVEYRKVHGKGFPAEVMEELHDFLDKHKIARAPRQTKIVEPLWMEEARARIGEKEVPGPKHNSWISEGWGRLGASWFNSDETPWCGFFVAHCIEFAKLPYPSTFPRARSWASWGKPCRPQVGAVVVFERGSGGHVGFLVGEGPTTFYVLGGNQSNAVNIAPIAKSRLIPNGIRWPTGQPETNLPLPRLAGGVISRNEA